MHATGAETRAQSLHAVRLVGLARPRQGALESIQGTQDGTVP